MSDKDVFEQEIISRVKDYNSNYDLQNTKNQFHDELIKAKYAYNFTWCGVPIIQEPQDIQAKQEIIWKTKPDLIIETGIAWGGSLALSASMLVIMESLGIIKNGLVVGIDIDVRPHTKEMLRTHPLSNRIGWMEVSSIEKETMMKTLEQIIFGFDKSEIKDRKIMVCLDSNHTHDHVFRELLIYSPLVSLGCYIIVDDTGIEDLVEDAIIDRPWKNGNSPGSAVLEFLDTNKDFEMDTFIPNKLLLTGTPYGYIKRVK